MRVATSDDPLIHKLHGVAVYNPDLLSEEELKAVFIARQDLLDRLVNSLQADRPAHTLIVGVRGTGKTTLLRRLKYSIHDEPSLSSRWLPLVFPEEQYNVTRLSDFYLNCLDALSDALEALGDQEHTQEVDRFIGELEGETEDTIAVAAREGLQEISRRLQRGLVLLVDNAERILDDLSEDEGWAFRELLSDNDGIVFIGASTQAIESSYEYNQPFYDFFDVRELRGFTAEETELVLRKLAETTDNPQVATWIDDDPARLKTLNNLSGGNPRTVVLLFQLLVQGVEGDVRSDLERLLDMCTPLYKARFEELPAQAQQILDALAMLWEPATAAQVAEKARLDVTKASSQLSRLVRQGLVQKVPLPPGKRTGFQIAERFFNIWYLMRASRRVRRRLLWLAQFLKLFYSESERRQRVHDYLQSEPADSQSALRHAEYGFALAHAVSDLKQGSAVEYRAMTLLNASEQTRRQIAELLDLDGADHELKPVAERLRLMAEARDFVFGCGSEVWPEEINRETFWHLFAGSLSISIQEKHGFASVLEDRGVDVIRQTYEILAKECANWMETVFRGCDVKLLDALYTAVASGYLDGPDDLASAPTAAEALGSPQLLTIVGYWAAEIGAKKSEAAYRDFIKIAPKSTGAWNGLGNLLQGHLSRYDQAEQAYRQAIEIDPKSAYPWNGLGDLLQYHLSRYDQAEQAYRKAIEIDPKFAHPWNGLGNLLKNHHSRYDEAEQAYRNAIEIDPKFAHPWNGLGNLLQYHLSRYDEAEQAYRKAIEIDPKYADPWNGLGNLLKNHLSRYGQAEQAYRQAIDIDPKDAYPWNGLGNLLMDYLSRYEEAEQAYRKAIEIDPEFAYPWNGLGNLLQYHLSRYEEAEQAYRKAIEIDPEFAYPWNGLGNLLQYHLSRFEQAEQAYRQAIEIDPKFAYPWNGLGNLLQYHLSRYDEAEQAYRKAIEIDPKYAYPWNGLGNLLQDHLSRYDEAEQAYRKAIEIDPKYAYPWNGLGNLLQYHLSRYEEAEQAYRQAIEAAPDSSRGLNALAWFLYQRGGQRLAEAEEYGRQAFEMSPESPHVAHTYATILLRNGRWFAAIEPARRFLETKDTDFFEQCWPDIVTFFREAAHSGHAEDAAKLLEECGRSEQWRPLVEALMAVAENSTDRLVRLAPEMRAPADELYKQFVQNPAADEDDR